MTENKLRICLLSETWHPEVNGVAMTMNQLSRELESRGHTVHVIRPKQEVDTTTATLHTLVQGFSLPGYPGLQLGVPAYRTVRKALEQHSPHVLHVVTEGPLGIAGVLAARHLKIPITSSYHTHFAGYSRHYGVGVLAPIIKHWLNSFHRNALCTMAPTTEIANSLTKSGIKRTEILGRGVDTQLFSPHKRCEKQRAQWSLGESDLAILYVGRLAAEKNLQLVTRTVQAIEAQQKNTKMIWVGDSPMRQRLEKGAINQAFAGVLHDEDLARAYASADIFLFPSMTETYGNVVAEALASGLAVVAFHEAAAAQLIQPGHNGATAATGDEDTFIRLATSLALSHEQQTQYRQNAPIPAINNNWQHVCDVFERALHHAITAH